VEVRRSTAQRTGIVTEVDDRTLDIFGTLERSADDAVSPKGAVGHWQIMPETASGLGFDPARLTEHDYNKEVARAVVTDLAKKFGGNLQDMLVAYNAGPGRARAWIAGGRKVADLPLETQHYLERAEAAGFTRGGIVWEQAKRALELQGDKGDWVPERGELPVPVGASLSDELAKVEAAQGGGGGGGKEPPTIDLNVDDFPAGKGLPGRQGITDQRLTLSLEMALDRMSDVVAPEKAQGWLPEWLNPRKVIAAFQSELAPAKRIDRQVGVEAGQVGVEDMARQVYAAQQRASYALQFGTLRLGENAIEHGTDASYKSAFRAVKEDGGTAKGFIEYRIAARTVEKAEQAGIATGADLRTALFIMSHPEARAKYQRGASILRESKDALVDYAKDSGLFSAAQANAIKRLNRDHIVFRRVMEPDYNPPSYKGGLLRPRTPTKAMKGSERQIVDPLTAEIDNYHTFIAMADRNRAVGNIIALVEGSHNLGQNGPETRLLWHDRTEGSPSRPLDLFDEQGNPIPPEAQPALAPFLAERGGSGLAGNEFVFFRKGEREVWKARDPDLAALMKAPPAAGLHPLVQLGAKIAGLARLGIVSTPDFLLRALTHGQLASSAFSEGGRKLPFLDIAQGLAHVLRRDEEFREAVRNGALAGAMTDLDVNYLRANAGKVFDETGTRSAVTNVFRHPIDALHALHSTLDNAARVGAFQRLQAAGLSDLKAASLSRTAYLDHAEGRAHAGLRAFATTVPFMEIGFKDLEQVTGAFRRNPVAATLTAATVLTAPTLVNYVLNYLADFDLPAAERYHEQPRWERDMYWVTPPIAGVRLKIMRPYVGGFLFATLPERVLDFLFYNEQGKPLVDKETALSFVAQVVPPFLPTGVTPILEQVTDHDFFTQRRLVPSALEHLSGYMQYKPDTTETAKAFSRALGPARLDWADVSPIVIENYARQWAGTLPWNLLRTLDRPFEPVGKPSELADLPFMGSFFVRHQQGLQTVTDFYDEAREFEEAHGDVRKALAEGNPDLLSRGQWVEAALRVTEFSQAMHRMQGVLAAVDKSEMTSSEKLKYSDAIAAAMLGTAKAGLQAMEAAKRATH
jgi:hypothetical protein